MRRIELLLLLALLVVFDAAQAGRKSEKKKRPLQLPLPGYCHPNQSFERGYKYWYTYEATVKSENRNTSKAISGIKIRCNKIQIRVPFSCFGVMTVSGCSSSEGTLLPEGSLIYPDVFKKDLQLQKKLGRYPLYFIFNQGKIGSIFVDPSDATDAINMKRAMLSSLQMKFNEIGIQIPIYQSVKIPEVSIFGYGTTEWKVMSVEKGFAKTVLVKRNLTEHKLPWEREQRSSFHFAYDGLELSKLITDLYISNWKTYNVDARQSCNYTLEYGRHVTEAKCVEYRPSQFFGSSIFQPFIKSMGGDSYMAYTTISIYMKHVEVARMKRQDRISPSQVDRLNKFYEKESIMFEKQWQESLEDSFIGYNPVEAIHVLISSAENSTTAGLYAKTARFIAKSTKTVIEDLWNTVSRRHGDGHQLEKASNLWVQLLHGCSSTSSLCHLPDCEPNIACQKALGSFIDSTEMTSWAPYLEKGVLKALASNPTPDITILRAALRISRAKPKPLTVMTLGKVISKYDQKLEVGQEHQVYTNAVEYLQSLLNNDCETQASDVDSEDLMIAAIKSIAALSNKGMFTNNSLIACALNIHASKRIALSAIQALSKMTLEDGNVVRTGLLAILSDPGRSLEVRLASYLFIIYQEPSRQEIESVLSIAHGGTQSRSLKYYIKEHIKSQLTLRDTSFCELSKSTIKKLISVYRYSTYYRWRSGVNLHSVNGKNTVVERTYEYTKPMLLPYTESEINCTVKSTVIWAKNSFIPMLANLSLLTKIEDRNITILEAKLDLVSFVSVLKPLFGSNSIFPNHGVDKLFQMPLVNLFQPAIQEMPAFPDNEIRKLTKLQDEASMAYNILKMKNQSPFELKIFDMPIKMESLFKLNFMRDLKLINVWNFAEKLEKGWKYDGVFADQPLLAQFAIPTSIGSPHLHHIETAYYQHVHFEVRAQFKKIFLTGRGEVSLVSKAAVRASSMWLQKVLLPNGIAAGTGYQLSSGHSSDFDAGFVATNNEVKIKVKPLPEATEIISLKVNEGALKNKKFDLIELSEECLPVCLNGDCQREVDVMIKSCVNPLDLGIYLKSGASDYYDASMTWGPLTAIVDNNPSVACKGIELRVNKKLRLGDESRQAMRVSAKYITSVNEIRFEFASGDQQAWIFGANALLYRTADTSSFESVLASINLTKPSGEVVSKNIFKITKNVEGEEVMEEFLDSSNPSKSIEQARYLVDAQVELPLNKTIVVSGLIQPELETGGYKARIKFTNGPEGEDEGVPHAILNLATKPVIEENGVQGFLSEARIELFPVSSFPYSSFRSFIKAINDSAGNGYLLFDAQTKRKNNEEPYFISNRFDFKKSLSDKTPFGFYGTITTNAGQIQFDLIAPSDTAFEVTKRIFVTKKSIVLSKVKHDSQQSLRLATNDASIKADIYFMGVRGGENADGDISMELGLDRSSTPSVFGIVKRDFPSYKGLLVLYPKQCSRCHYFIIQSPYFNVKSDLTKEREKNNERGGHEAYMDFHKSILNYLPIAGNFKDTIIKYTISPYNDHVKIGYNYESNFVHDKELYAKVGYNLAEKVFLAVLNISTWEGDLFHMNRFVAAFNFTCVQCIPHLDTNLTTNIGWRYSKKIPKNYTDIVTHASRTYVDFYLQRNEDLRFNSAVKFNSMFDRGLLIKGEVEAFAKYWNEEIGHYAFLPNYDYIYKTGVNIILKDVQSRRKRKIQDYDLSLIMGFTEDSPLFVGYVSVNNRTDYRSYPKFCLSKGPCITQKLELKQVSKCGNFETSYSGRSNTSRPLSTECSSITIDAVWSRDAHNTNIEFDGTRNPSSLFNRIEYNRMKDLERNEEMYFNISLSHPIWLLPANVSLHLAEISDQLTVAFNSDQMHINVHEQREGLMTVDVTTMDMPLILNCSGTINSSRFQEFFFSFPRCSLAQPILHPAGPVNAAITGRYHFLFNNQLNVIFTRDSTQVGKLTMNLDHDSHNILLICGPENDPSSPCEISVTKTPRQFSLSSRIVSIMFNHTAHISTSKVGLTFISLWNNAVNPTFRLDTTNTLLLHSIPVSVSYDAKVRHGLTEGLLVDTSFYALDYIESKLMIENGRLTHYLTRINSTRSSIMKQPPVLLIDFTSSEKGSANIQALLSIGEMANLDTALVYGENNPDSRLHFPTIATGTYLSAGYFNFTSYKYYTIVRQQNLYSNDGSLFKMVSLVKLNMWPFMTSEQSTIFGFCLCPFCIGELEGSATYDTFPATKLFVKASLAKNKEIIIDYISLHSTKLGMIVSNFSQPFLTANATVEGPRYEANLECGTENDLTSPCSMRVVYESPQLTWRSKISTTLVNHSAKISIMTPRNTRATKVFGMKPDMVTYNSIKFRDVPIVCDVTMQMEEDENVFWNTTLRLGYSFNNSMIVRRGELESFLFEGKIIKLLLIPDSLHWHISFSTMPSFVYLRFSLGKDIIFITETYHGANDPNVLVHHSSFPEHFYVDAFYFNFTASGQTTSIKLFSIGTSEVSISEHTLVLANSNIWPFINNLTWFEKMILPQSSYLPLCLGEIDLMADWSRDGNTNRIEAKMLSRGTNEYIWTSATSDQVTKLNFNYKRSSALHFNATFTGDQDRNYEGRLLCGEDEKMSLPCDVRITSDNNDFVMKSLIRTKILNHSADINVSYLLYESYGRRISIQTRSSVCYKSVTATCYVTVKRDEGTPLLVDTSLNFTDKFINRVYVKEEELTELLLIGKSLYFPLFFYPISWKCGYKNSDAYDKKLKAEIFAGKKFSMSFLWNRTRNEMTSLMLEQNPDKYVEKTCFKLSSCQPLVIVSRDLSYSTDTKKLKKMHTHSYVNMWPFVNENILSRIFESIMPSYLKCPMCLGTLNTIVFYDEEKSFTSMNMTLGKKIEVLSKYSSVQDVTTETELDTGFTQIIYKLNKWKTQKITIDEDSIFSTSEENWMNAFRSYNLTLVTEGFEKDIEVTTKGYATPNRSAPLVHIVASTIVKLDRFAPERIPKFYLEKIIISEKATENNCLIPRVYNVTFYTEDLEHNFKGMNVYEYKPEHVLRNQFNYASERLIVSNELDYYEEVAQSELRYKTEDATTYGYVIMIAPDHIEVRNLNFETMVMKCNLKTVTVDFIRTNQMQIRSYVGFNMRDLSMKLTFYEYYKPNTILDIVGNTRILFNGTKDIDIHDATRRLLNINFTTEKGDTTTETFVIKLDLPVLKVDWRSLVAKASDHFTRNYIFSMSGKHFLTGKPMPFFKASYVDSWVIESQHYIGGANWSMHAWNPINPNQEWKPVGKFSIKPIHEGRVLNLTFDIYKGTYITFKSTLSNDCRYSIAFYDMESCVTRTGITNAIVNFPIMKLAHGMEWSDNHNVMDLDASFLIWNHLKSQMISVFDHSQRFNMRLKEGTQIMVGSWNTSSTSIMLWKTKMESFILVKPNDNNTARTFEIQIKPGPLPRSIFTVSEPIYGGRRRIVFNALNREMIKATVSATGCSSKISLIPGYIDCLPLEINVNDLKADIPVIMIFRQIPVIGISVPESDMLNIELVHSSILFEVIKSYSSVALKATLHLQGPSFSTGSEVESFLQINSTDLVTLIKMDQWNASMNFKVIPMSSGYILDTKTNLPWLINHIRLVARQGMHLDELIIKRKTLDLSPMLIPIDIDYEYRSDIVENSWNSELKSFTLHATPSMRINTSLSFDDTMKNIFVHWDFLSHRFPALDHLVNFKFIKDQNTHELKQYFTFGSIFVWINLTTTKENEQCLVKSFQFGMTDSPCGVEVTFRPPTAPSLSRTIVMTWKDTEDLSYVCDTSMNQSYVVHTFCNKVRARSAPFPDNATEVARYSFDWSIARFIKFATKAAHFNASLLLQSEWWRDIFIEDWEMTDAHLRSRFSDYLSLEVNRISRALLTTLYSPQYEQIGLDEVSLFLSDLPTLSRYLDLKMSTYKHLLRYSIEKLTKGYITFDVTTTDKYTVYQFNFTCKECEFYHMQFETKIWKMTSNEVIANISLKTNYIQQYIVVKSGLTLKPVLAEIKAANNPSKITIKFETENSEIIGFDANMTMPNGKSYTCKVLNRNADSSMNCSCYKLKGNSIAGQPIATFSIPKRTILTYCAYFSEFLMPLMTDSVELFLRDLLNIGRPALAKRLTVWVEEVVYKLKKYYDRLWPSSPFYHTLKAATKLAVRRLSSEELQEENEYYQLAKALYKNFMLEADKEGFKIELFRNNLGLVALDFYFNVDVKQNEISLLMNVTSAKMSILNLTLREVIKYEADELFESVQLSNSIIQLESDWNLKNLTFAKAKIGVVDSNNTVKIKATGTNDIFQYTIKFNDTEGSPYTCQAQKISTNSIKVTCRVKTSDNSTAPVCEFDLPTSAFSPDQVILKSILLVPEIVLASENSRLFKKRLREKFGFTNERSLNVISAYLKKESKKILNEFNENVIKYHINKAVGTTLGNYGQDVMARGLIRAITSARLNYILSQRRSFLNIFERLIDDVFREIVQVVAEEGIWMAKKIIDIYQQIEGTIGQFIAVYPTGKESYRAFYMSTVKNIIPSTYDIAKKFYKTSYLFQQLSCNPDRFEELLSYVYDSTYVVDYMKSLFQTEGSTYNWFNFPNVSQVVSYKGEYFELPVVPSTSQCVYAHATDPIYNSFNVLSKGSALLIALSQEILEFMPDRSIYVTKRNSERSELSLPYFTNEVACNLYRDEIVCRTPQLQLALSFARRDRMEVNLKLLEAEFSVGAMGIYTTVPTPYTFMKADGSEARNAAEFMNAYELTGRQECVITSENISRSHESRNAQREMCGRAFITPNLMEASKLFPSWAKSFKKACITGSSGRNMDETCFYTNAFIKHLRQMGTPMLENNNCLSCKLNNLMTADIDSKKAEVFLLLSLSVDSFTLQTMKDLRKIISKTLSRMDNESPAETKIGIITYGGQHEKYAPAILSFHGAPTSNDEEALINAIKNLEFNGPAYAPSSTLTAVDYAVTMSSKGPAGAARTFIVSAPENYDKNCAAYDVEKLITKCKKEMASVIMWSSLGMIKCETLPFNLILKTQGNCFSVTDDSAQDVADFVIDNLAGKLETNFLCDCDVTNPYSGETSNKCDLASEIIVN